MSSDHDVLRLTVLGPVRAWRNGVEVSLGGPQSRTLLAILLTCIGRPVPLTDIVDVLWGEQPPPRAVNAVHGLVGTLRRVLGPSPGPRENRRRLLRSGGGYQLAADDSEVDLLALRRSIRAARDAAAGGRLAEAVEEYRSGLNLWEGKCAGNLSSAIRSHPMFTTLDRECLAVAREAADCALRAGQGERLLDAIRKAADQDRLDEPLQARLMLLLHAAGQRAQALSVFAEVRAALAEDLGVDPGEELSTAHMAVLRDHPGSPLSAVLASAPAVTDEIPPVIRPAQLPRDLSTFTGRRTELQHAATLAAGAGTLQRTVIIIAVSGMAGVGKTTLAVRWAHQLAEQYPDGQLYVNLRGFSAEGSAVSASEALTGFLHALGLRQGQIPQDVDAQSAAFRSLLADRRVLVVLDNARDSEQVMPLLPGGAGCLAIVTSRNRLTGLVVSAGAHAISLDVLSPPDARELLERRIGAARVAAEPAAVDVLVQRCGGLPLALAIIAGRAAAYPELTLAHIADELKEERTSLDAFADYDVRADPRAVFSWSYRSLTPAAARLFRLIGATLTGPHLSLIAAANLAGLSARGIRPLLAELLRANMLTQPEPGRHVIHDLLASYAAEMSATFDTEQQRHDAWQRMLDYHLHASYEAQNVLFQRAADSSAPGPMSLAAVAELPSGREAVQTWLDGELPVILAAIHQAVSRGFVENAWRTCMTLVATMDVNGRWSEWLSVMEEVGKAVEQDGTPVARAHIARAHGLQLAHLHRFDEAVPRLDYAHSLFEALGDDAGMGITNRMLAYTFALQGLHSEALGHAIRARDGYRKSGDIAGEGLALNMMGLAEGALGNYDKAIEYGSQALQMFETIDHLRGTAATYDSLGTAYRRQGRYKEAAEHYEQAIVIRRDFGDLVYVATSLHRLGDTLHEAGDEAEAAASWRTALEVMTTLGHPHADEVRAKLAGELPAVRYLRD